MSKSQITAKVIEDSISAENVRLTTIQLRFPRFILAEFNTHRQFSRNARSTRAVPTKKLIQEIINDPVLPLEWLKNKPGMQASEPMDADTVARATEIWLDAAKHAAKAAEQLFELGLHKQWAGRIIEPFMYVDVLLSSTHWQNFDVLRDHDDAQPEIHLLAEKIIEARKNSNPRRLKLEEWHLPYVTEDERINNSLENNLKLSTARCARISFTPFDGDDSIEKEFERFTKLVGSTPIHASPAEHQATPDEIVRRGSVIFPIKEWKRAELHGNLTGFVQHRKLIPCEYNPDSWETNL